MGAFTTDEKENVMKKNAFMNDEKECSQFFCL